VRHPRRWHTYLYPKDMRTRYVAEIEALTEELLSDATFRRRSLALDLVVSGFRARIRQWRTHKWLVPAVAVCAIAAGVLIATSAGPPPPLRPAASSQQQIIEGVPPKHCTQTGQSATSSGYLCYVVLNPKTGATESATIVRLTSPQADCLRSGRSGRSVMTCLPTSLPDPHR
jgi:hypothetical protein